MYVCCSWCVSECCRFCHVFDTAAAAAAAAVWLREGLVRLGPTFIKIGQQFSTRVDVLSPEFVKELEKLQVRAAGVNADAS
jgi:predicted unusual protein kinase regulating ubiquinone biosynthesis (AarF/ABC1/UbiB family)